MPKSTLIEALTQAYFAELETIMNYLANAENLDGVRAKHIATELKADVADELGHAQRLAARIKTIGGTVPGSESFRPTQRSLQPPKKSTDVIAVIKGVIDAEQAAVDMYRTVIETAEAESDYPTQDMATQIMADEEEHLRTFKGYLKEYESA